MSSLASSAITDIGWSSSKFSPFSVITNVWEAVSVFSQS